MCIACIHESAHAVTALALQTSLTHARVWDLQDGIYSQGAIRYAVPSHAPFAAAIILAAGIADVLIGGAARAVLSKSDEQNLSEAIAEADHDPTFRARAEGIARKIVMNNSHVIRQLSERLHVAGFLESGTIVEALGCYIRYGA